MKILRTTQIKPLAPLTQVSRTDGNTTCTQESSGHLICTFSYHELDNHTPLAFFQNWRNIKTGEEGHGQPKALFFCLCPSPDLYKDNSDLRLFCKSLSRESCHSRALSNEGLNQVLRNKKETAIRRELITYSNNDLDLLFFEMLQLMTHSQDKGVRAVLFWTSGYDELGLLAYIYLAYFHLLLNNWVKPLPFQKQSLFVMKPRLDILVYPITVPPIVFFFSKSNWIKSSCPIIGLFFFLRFTLSEKRSG